MKLKVEEEILQLSGFLIATGIMGKLKAYPEAKLTSARLSYTDGTEDKHIHLSSIRQCRMSKHLFRRLIRITCTDVVYHVTCDGDLEHFYQTLLDAMKKDEACVCGSSNSIGGISRLMQMMDSRIETMQQLRTNAMTDLQSLKKMGQRMVEMARRLQTEQGTIMKSFEALKVDAFAETPEDVKHVMTHLMKNNDIILLQDLFCAVNRLRLCEFLTPGEVRLAVESLQAEGICKIVDLHGVSTVFSGDISRLLDSIVRMVANGPITILQLAQVQNISIPLAEYMLLYAQVEGVVTRDDGLYHVQYYHNPFID